MVDTLRVAVFCGFSLDELGPDLSNEILFAYQLLTLFGTGRLELDTDVQPNDKDPEHALARFRAASKANHDDLIGGKFTVFYSQMRPEFLDVLRKALEDDRFDYALVIVPKRRCLCGGDAGLYRTTPFVPMEFALAEGYGKAPIAFVEEGVPKEEIPLITENVRPRKTFSRDQLENTSNWGHIVEEMKDLEEQALANRRLHFGLPNSPIEGFYLRLCRLLLTANRVSIVNHSLLPLGSSFDQDDTGECTFTSPNQAVSARDLYFELEAALVTENGKRLECLLTQKPREWDPSSLLERVEYWARDSKREFILERAISVPGGERFDQLDRKSRDDLFNRYRSIFQSIGRMEKRQSEAESRTARQLRLQYTLRAFPTVSLRSFPTTLLLCHDNETETGIWGFLRSNQNNDVRTDDFLITHHCSMVSVLKKHVEMHFESEDSVPIGERHSSDLIQRGGWNPRSVEGACKSLEMMIANKELTKRIAYSLKSFVKPAEGFAKWLTETASS